MVFFEEFNDGHCSVEFKILRGFYFTSWSAGIFSDKVDDLKVQEF